ncbi:hypothetical protein Dimus_019352 [Dionaea muscipula]
MALALAPPHNSSATLRRCSPSSQNNLLLAGHLFPRLSIPRPLLSGSFISCARRRPFASPLKKTKRHKKSSSEVEDEDEPDEDAFESLFKQLEHDLENDGQLSDDDEDDISELDLAKLELELKGELAGDGDLSGQLSSTASNAEGGEEEELMEKYTGDEEEEAMKLKGWQLRRLAYALKKGRRKTSIKSLAAELGLDRSLVLELLRDPPTSLLMMSASLPDKSEPGISIPKTVEVQPVSSETEPIEPNLEVKPPIHVLQTTWSAQKRLKKVHVATLEKVYERTKRPTNAMISSIVHLTNLPRKKIVKWFEDKRAADGIPEDRRPHKWISSETVLLS